MSELRPRKEIEANAAGGMTFEQELLLEVLLDIRDLLTTQRDDVSRCGHGATGVCMSCVIQNDLLRPRQ